jgi:hypothetical protein
MILIIVNGSTNMLWSWLGVKQSLLQVINIHECVSLLPFVLIIASFIALV